MSDLKATKREKLTTGSNNNLRAKGFIPAILYGGKENNLNINRDKLTKTITNVGLMGCVYLAIIVQLALDSLVWG